MLIKSVGLLGLEVFNKVIQKHGPAIVFFYLVDVIDSSGKFIHHFPEIFMHLFGFLHAVIAVFNELVVKRHHFLQVQSPNLHCRVVLHRQILANQVKLVRPHVHVLEMTLVLVYSSLQVLYVFW